ncbi:hypothetical protein HPB49_016619 [Dermacentor silvarum]|uniref:Uncharacterized protein n=1 Tax=Dermacentor silvarum TaxID=543639 RepID=A0ACB8CS64_DERSI|nr:hypothetical protein HPB49_016619 [Dermacentor silvarum]
MKFSSARTPAEPSNSMRGVPLPVVGVTFTSTLDFSLQISSVVAKARVFGFISGVSKPSGPATFSLLYTSLVCSVVPTQQHVIASIESIQKSSLAHASSTLHRAIKPP